MRLYALQAICLFSCWYRRHQQNFWFIFQINNMKAKFKETLERCDNLERRVTEIGKEKQGMDKK